MQKVANKRKVGGRKILVFPLSADETDLSKYHMVFFSEQMSREQSREALDRVKTRPIITVSDNQDFHDLGGLITFVQVNQNIRFQWESFSGGYQVP